MRYLVQCLALIILLLSLVSMGHPEDFSLQYFLAKASSKESELSNKEQSELLNRIQEVLEQAQRIQRSLIDAIQVGEVKLEYQEGRFWMSKLEEDGGSVETGIVQLRLLREKPTHLVAAMKLYKSLRDLSSHFNAYNNTPLFSAFIGDLAPEMELWVDPIFYRLYLLPLAHSKDREPEPAKKEERSVPKEKEP